MIDTNFIEQQNLNSNKGQLITVAFFSVALIQVARSYIGHLLDVYLPPAYSYRNNFIEVILYIGLAYIVARGLSSLLGNSVWTILGLNRILWSPQLLWLLPFLPYYLFDLTRFRFSNFNLSGLLLAVAYCLIAAFVIETHSRGIITSILYPFEKWMTAIITGILLILQGTVADLVQYGTPVITIHYALGMMTGFAYAFTMTSLRLRIGSLIPIIIVSIPVYFFGNFGRISQSANPFFQIGIVLFFLVWGNMVLISLHLRSET